MTRKTDFFERGGLGSNSINNMGLALVRTLKFYSSVYGEVTEKKTSRGRPPPLPPSQSHNCCSHFWIQPEYGISLLWLLFLIFWRNYGEKTDNLASSVTTWLWVSPLKFHQELFEGNLVWIQCEKVCPVSTVKIDII